MKLKMVVLAIGILFSVGKLRADSFDFTFSTDPVGCQSVGNCALPFSGSGIFTTGPGTISPDYHNTVPVFPVTSILGTLDGFSMTLAAPPDGVVGALVDGGVAGWQLITQEPLVFNAHNQEWSLFRQDLLHPAGTDNLLYNYSTNSYQAVHVQIVSMAEPSTIAFAGLGMLCLLGVALRKARIS